MYNMFPVIMLIYTKSGLLYYVAVVGARRQHLTVWWSRLLCENPSLAKIMFLRNVGRDTRRGGGSKPLCLSTMDSYNLFSIRKHHLDNPIFFTMKQQLSPYRCCLEMRSLPSMWIKHMSMFFRLLSMWEMGEKRSPRIRKSPI